MVDEWRERGVWKGAGEEKREREIEREVGILVPTTVHSFCSKQIRCRVYHSLKIREIQNTF